MDTLAADLHPDAAWLADYLRQSAETMARLVSDKTQGAAIARIALLIERSMAAGGKLLVAGNGGSAADAQHIAAEFVGRLMYDRAPLPAIALTTDSSAFTAIGNDYGFEAVFARQVSALGRPGDVFIGISTSGRSPNILRAIDAARLGGMVTVGLTGETPAAMAGCDALFCAPSGWTPLIQQMHITAAHAVCGLVERALRPQGG
ncbi:D-sedoheptulose 7-phosphate isomerase [Endobacter medicaginis]|jgi:D-sedoheptulose 7-phosphate isomerase|uniref:Phosphoheptose isomerase n=1 Tax=Endobacter medicaginis TaxID=1181271 RepID=A0A839V048_9PROT|nr:D-sedoheptulose 7-phosphate isomerase [Endobacter medicaginis]MBB3173012.1 D-sedoheptulose 7-phosphate isomerase [Endobacter medicaginis]MCX5475209.1 D-sedoheptulose 7-phosphate isomerase [Endobacter medicaginis]NVN29268.1 D-sedoheptulose 7-phosphate isomerase [Endobacter medicaginis]